MVDCLTGNHHLHQVCTLHLCQLPHDSAYGCLSVRRAQLLCPRQCPKMDQGDGGPGVHQSPAESASQVLVYLKLMTGRAAAVRVGGRECIHDGPPTVSPCCSVTLAEALGCGVLVTGNAVVRSVFCPCLISVFVCLVWSHVCSHV